MIGLLGNTNLYCSSMDAIETVASPTFYCTFQGWTVLSKNHRFYFQVVTFSRGELEVALCICLGIVDSAALTISILTSVFHVCFIFFKLVFPICARKCQPHYKWIHMGFLCVGTFLYLILYAIHLVISATFATCSFSHFLTTIWKNVTY